MTGTPEERLEAAAQQVMREILAHERNLDVLTPAELLGLSARAATAVAEATGVPAAELLVRTMANFF